jgi:cyanophycinase
VTFASLMLAAILVQQWEAMSKKINGSWHEAWMGLVRGLAAAALSALVLATPAWAAGGDTSQKSTPTYSSKAYDYYLTGSAADMQPPSPRTQLLVLMGGGIDVDAAFRAMTDKAGSATHTKVDVVVIRASGADGYNQYLYDMGGADSVETLVIKSREGADDPELNRIVAAADVLFIAGGDQWNYIRPWKGSRLDATLQQLIARKVPFGGTSAGLAVLGQFDFSAENGTITSDQALSNPYDRRLTLEREFITTLPGLGGTIADAHLATRDRMGRLLTFLARIIADGWVDRPDAARAIGVDEQTAVLVDAGRASVLGVGAAYFLRPSIAATTIQAKRPLTLRSVQVNKLVAGGGDVDLLNWPATPAYTLSVESGVLTSSAPGGSVY